MTDKPLWRHEMELPNPDDFEKQDDYEQAMNQWAHDRLYGLDDDRTAYEKQQEYELGLLYDEDDEDEYYEEDEQPTCSCEFCYCGSPVSVPGAKCNDCYAGAHQG